MAEVTQGRPLAESQQRPRWKTGSLASRGGKLIDVEIINPLVTTQGVFDVRIYGAVGDGSTDDSDAVQAAIDAAVAAGGGTVLLPGGLEYVCAVSITDNVPIRLSGYGATLIPKASSTVIAINSGNGSTAVGHTIDGISIDGSGISTTKGITITNTDRVRIRDVRISACTTGVELITASSGWVEETSFEHVWIEAATTGILFNPASGTSFAETAMFDVGLNNNTTGLKVSNTANIYRSRLISVVAFINSSQTGFDFQGDFRGVIAMLAVETTGTPTGATGFWLASTATNLRRAQFNIEFTGSINTPVGSAGPYLIWSEGPQWHMSPSGDQPAGWAQYQDTWQRSRIENEMSGGGGISFGPGDADLDVSIGRYDEDVLYTPDDLRMEAALQHTGSTLGVFGTAPTTKPTVTGSRGGNAALANLLTALAGLGLLTDSTS